MSKKLFEKERKWNVYMRLTHRYFPYQFPFILRPLKHTHTHTI